jgi:hypothetical protein
MEPNSGQLISLSPAPALSVCSEARTELLPTYPQLPNAPGASIIYVDPLEDVVLIREDKRGTLVSQNRLLAAVLGSPAHQFIANPPIIITLITTTMWDISGIRHLAVDFWVMDQAWNNLRALTSLRNLESFAIILVDRQPQTAQSPNGNCTSYPRKTVGDLKSVGFGQNDVRRAVQHFWGVTSTTNLTCWTSVPLPAGTNRVNFVSQNVRHRMSRRVSVQISRLQRFDNHWVVPLRELLTYGPYAGEE